MTYERKKELYDFAIKNAEKSLGEAKEQQKLLDSIMLKFSAGAFALSFSIINTFIPLACAKVKIILFLSWLSFTLSIVAGLLSFIIAVNKHTYDYDFELERYELLSNDSEEPEYKKNFYWLCHWLNNFTFVFFVLGILCLLFFVFKNI